MNASSDLCCQKAFIGDLVNARKKKLINQMEKQLWAIVRISVHPNRNKLDERGNWRANHYHWHVIKEWNYPKWIIDRHRRFFTWVQALVQVRFPGHNVSFSYAGYYPETRERLASKRQMAISAAKAQVTRIENALRDYEAEKSTSLWSDLAADPLHRKLTVKLEQKKYNLQQAVMMAVEETV